MESTRTSAWPRIGIGFAVAATIVLGTADLSESYDLAAETALVLSVLRAVPVLLVRRWPVPAWWLTFGTCTAVGSVTLFYGYFSWFTWPWAFSSMAVLAVATGFLAAQGRRRRTVLAVALVAAAGAVPTASISIAQWQNAIVCTVVVGLAALSGDIVHARRRVSGELAEEKQVSAGERARRSLAEERARIARELHDVVAHHMSMITVQAETARYRIPDLPEPVADEFTGIAKLARGSLTELRGLLSALRDEQDAPALAPQPTLADLSELVDRITAAGTPVRLTVGGDLTVLPAAVQLSAYRIVQEALSNVVRHAPGAASTVDIRAAGDLTVEVANERPAGPVPAPGDGHGLVGLRERTTLLGGTFEVDRPGGGWRVRATLPAAALGEAR